MSLSKNLFNYSTITFAINILNVIILCLGICGNSITCLVFSQKRFKKSSFAFYFRILALADTMQLFNTFFKWLEFFLDFSIFNRTYIGCKLGYYLYVVFSLISPWILFIISFDRLTTIVIGLHTIGIFKKRSFQITLVSLIFVYSFSLAIAIPIYSKFTHSIGFNNQTNRTENETKCDNNVFNSRRIVQINNIVGLVLMVITTTISIFILFKSRQSNSTRNSIKKSSASESRKDVDRKYAINSVVLNLIFFIKILIFLTLLTFFHFIHNRQVSDMIQSMAGTIFLIGNGSMFFVNMTVNSNFRKKFFLMFKLKNSRLVFDTI